MRELPFSFTGSAAEIRVSMPVRLKWAIEKAAKRQNISVQQLILDAVGKVLEKSDYD